MPSLQGVLHYGWPRALAFLSISSLIVFPRSFLFLKMALLLTLTAFFIVKFNRKIFLRFPVPLLLLAISIAALGMTWSMIGLLNGGNLVGVFDSLRLYVFWSFAWALLSYFIILGGGAKLLHECFLWSAVAIVFINFAGVIDTWFSLDMMPFSLRDELKLFVGIHDGYIQITSHNIGSLFFLTSYFFITLISNRFPQNISFCVLAYVLLILLAICSGRRALWATVFISHSVAIIHSFISPRFYDRKAIKRILVIFALLGFFGSYFLITYADVSLFATGEHIIGAFSQEDERSIQAPFLISGFVDNFWFGSGFGVDAGYERNAERPWIYELIYHQLAFNFGIIGLIAVGLMSGWILLKSAIKLYRIDEFHYILAALYGCFSMGVANYSNPYIGSFDFMIYIWILPLFCAEIRGQFEHSKVNFYAHEK